MPTFDEVQAWTDATTFTENLVATWRGDTFNAYPQAAEPAH
jgi:hypothetical protein